MTAGIAIPDPKVVTPIVLRCGTLHLSVEASDIDLNQLCGFASRRSRKRGFVFVSKVLGKHFPVRPSVMAAVHARLAAKLRNLSGPVVLIAMAETATGLGHGVYEAWLRSTGRPDVLFIHTTRYHLRRQLALEFDESHSHAPEHLLFQPVDPAHARLFREAKTLLIVDDEISTGQTLVKLARAFRQLDRELESIYFICLTDWLGESRRGELAKELGLPVQVHSLLRGSFRFEQNPDFDPGPVSPAVGSESGKDAILKANFGRLGLAKRLNFDLEGMIGATGLRPGERVLVLGSGEFAHPPFLLAHRLEELGWDVRFQSTTRSPLLVDQDISSALEFLDNYDDAIPNYIYNFSDRRYDRVLIGYEIRPLPAGHDLPEKIGATPIFF